MMPSREGWTSISPRNTKPVVSVVVLTHNRRAQLALCLRSIQQSVFENLELIVVDDASTDGTNEMLVREFPCTKVITHIRPTLTARSINDGISASTGDYIVLIDDDNVVAPDFVATIASTLGRDARIGVVGPLCYYMSKPNVIMYAGVRLSRFSRKAIFVARNQEDRGQFVAEQTVDMFPNCFAISREAVATIGPVDAERLPFFNDDASLQLAAKRAGYQVVLNPKAKVWHDRPLEGDNSRTLRSKLRLYYQIRSKIVLERDYDTALGKLGFSVSLPIYLISYLVSVLQERIPAPERTALLRITLEAFFDGVFNRVGLKYVE